MNGRYAPSRHYLSLLQLFTLLLPVALIPMSPSVGHSQVTTNITSSGLNTQVNQVGNSHTITGGTRPGGGPSLFHSFGNFTVGGGDLANFLNNTGLPTSNILGRVTGGNISNIHGTIQTTGFGNANLFLMNPSGIVLGPGASLNVGGSVSFTTAQYIRLFDGLSGNANFYANPANDTLANSILTIDASAFEFLSASPAGYGFLTAPDPNATITVQGSTLSVPLEQSISLVGGKVVIEGGAKLTAPNGSIKLATAASPGEFDALALSSSSNTDGASFTSYGSASLLSDSSIDVHGAGTVLIKGGQLVLSVKDATLSTSENPVPTNTVALRSGSTIKTSNSRTDPGADVQITVGNIEMADASSIDAITQGSERGGAMQLTADTLTMSSSSILTATQGGGGAGGDLVLRVGTARLTDGSSIRSGAENFDTEGPGGNLIIRATESVTLSSASGLFSETFASTAGGNISLFAGKLIMEGANTTISTIATDVGPGGAIVAGVQQASLTAGATILSQTTIADLPAQSDPAITIRGLQGPKADSIFLSGSDSSIKSESVGVARARDIAIHTKSLTMTNGGRIEMVTSGTGGDITLESDSIDMSGRSSISSQTSRLDVGQIFITTAGTFSLNNSSISTNTTSEGRAGNLLVNAGTLLLSNKASITSTTNASGQAGDITLAGGTITLNSGSTISSASTGTEPTTNFDGTTAPPGLAGTITITALGDVTGDAGTIATSAEANRGGDISITAGNIRFSNGTLINANSNGPLTVTKLVLDANGQLVTQVVGDGNAGNIRITSGSTVVMEQSSVTTQARQASGGQITINAPEMIRLINSPISTSVAGAAGDSNGGNISIDPQFVILQGSPILARAFAGSGGAIDITAGLFLADPASTVDASSTLGVSGTVQINAPINNLSSVVARLPESLLAVQTLLRAACAAKLAQGATSSFVERGRDGIPTGPDGMLASPYLPITSERSVQLRGKPSIGQSGIQLRRLLGKDIPSSITLIPDHAACSS
jgi:filamentous hemagglutinin family protein